MGIFDDVIREHLDLKRQTGADEEELQELEDEAFGPPARPGDPDFPRSTSEESAVEPEADSSPAVLDADTAEESTPSGAVIDSPTEEEPALTPLDEAVGAETVEETTAEPQEPPAEPEAVEPEPPPELETALDEPELESADELEPSATSSFTTAEREAIADQPTVFFEQQEPAELELGDLELDLDEEIEEVGGAVSESLPDEEPLVVEEALAKPAPSAETEVAEPPHEVEPEPAPAPAPESESKPAPAAEPESDPTEPDPSNAVPPAGAAAPATEEEDVLEETPEFLRDNPDDDELWFEQGEPKDFDF